MSTLAHYWRVFEVSGHYISPIY